jgi:hypothetical protein
MNEEQLYRSIDQILWGDWDPIGMNDVLPRDEYSSYVPQTATLVIKQRNVHRIAEELYQIETVEMGLPGNFAACIEVAEKLIKLLQ